MQLTGGKGARVVFDPVGGPTIEKLVAAMAQYGISPTPKTDSTGTAKTGGASS